MLCVTGNERTIEAWLARVERADRRCRAANLSPPLHECRLDSVASLSGDWTDAIATVADRVIVSCRPSRQGGAYSGAEAERLDLLRRASDRDVAFVDLEADVPRSVFREWATRCGENSGARRPRIIASWHAFDGIPDDLGDRVRGMAELGADVLKVAARVDDAAEVARLLEAFRSVRLPRVVIGMSAPGLVSRTHYAALGSLFTYVAADHASATAPGQFDLEAAIAMGLPDSASSPFFGIVGGRNVLESPGPPVYNRLFRSRSRSSSYVPIVTGSLEQTLPLLQQLGAIGLSVTMPHKVRARSLCRADATASAIGAVNSLRWRGAWEGTNTDIDGIRAPLASHVASGRVRRAVVLGSGGAARAATSACRSLGLDVTIAARDPERARAVATDDAHPIAWTDRTAVGLLAGSVLLNATPLTGAECPWPDDAALDAALVFDTALGGGDSSLLARARAAGIPTIGPMSMWFAQGAAQMSWFLDEPIDAEELEALAR